MPTSGAANVHPSMGTLLLLSNGRGVDGFLTDYLPVIDSVLGTTREVAFVPFAAVSRTWEAYTDAVASALAPLGVHVVQVQPDASGRRSIDSADAILVGGGNTFRLLRTCRDSSLLVAIRRRVREGATYVGWSAGANLACPTICTTNDMPIIDPLGLDALALVPFQINPHYTNAALPGVHGETRDDRLAEFLHLNPAMGVLGLPERCWVRVELGVHSLGGPHPALWFENGVDPLAVPPGEVVRL